MLGFGLRNLQERPGAGGLLDDPELRAYLDGLDAAFEEAHRLGEAHGPRGGWLRDWDWE
jgi:hypothetical protein